MTAATLKKLSTKNFRVLAVGPVNKIEHTAVLVTESSRPVTVNVRPGSRMPLLRSATGRVFAAYRPEATVRPFIEQELAEMKTQKAPALSAKQLQVRLNKVRTLGLDHTDGEMFSGVLALAAPLFNHQNGLADVIAAFGPVGLSDDSIDGDTAHQLKKAAAKISERLGQGLLQ